ncbi:Hypothetical predicted protein [Paramuricea clavata]|uniref:Uncharacterized protein n=1 Tax=Paramuricea clavata TaxID=317549 RepID=A0A6S7HJJ9_PARCT|nr:Hypothetical predicted protein [Paramuricea clavata]
MEEKTYPQYDDLNYDDLMTAFSRLDTRVKGEAMYGDDPIVITNLKSELDYVKNLMKHREIVSNLRESLDEIEGLRKQETTFTEGNDGIVDISGSETPLRVAFVGDPNNVLPDVLDAFNESFDADWDEIEARLEKLKKFSEDRLTANKKRDFENQVERVQAVARVIKGKEGLVLDPKNKYVRELIKRSSVRTLKDGTEVLVFRSEQGIDKSGTQIMKRGKTKNLVYSKDSPALREYKNLIKKIKEVPTNPDNIIGSDEETREIPQFDESSEEYADRENIELIDISAQLGDLPGLTMQENNELRGVLNPPDGSSIEGRTGPNGVLQVQADYFNEAIGETVERSTSAEGTTEYNSLIERIDSLKEARDRTLEQRTVEEAREAQLEDISRLRRFVKWLGEEKVGLVGIAVSTASLITALLIHAGGAIVKTAKVTGKVAKALANLAKKAGPILVPILNTIATALSWGAKGITCKLAMEEHQEEYDDQKMEELNEKYPNYEEMDIETLDSKLPYLDKDLRESETTEETQDINEEINYVQELRRRKMLSEDLTREQLAEKFPDLSNLSYDDLMDRRDRLLNEIILSNLDEDSFKEKSEELRYVRMLSNDYQRESNLNKLLNLRDKVKKRDLIKRDDRRRLQRLRLWARENAGILSAVLISSSAVIIGLVASTRNILWKVGDTTEKLDKRISELVNNQVELPPVFQKIADGVELAADNIWVIIVCAAVVLLYKYN